MYLILGPHSRREFELTPTLLWATIIAQIHQAQPAVGDSGRPVKIKKTNLTTTNEPVCKIGRRFNKRTGSSIRNKRVHRPKIVKMSQYTLEICKSSVRVFICWSLMLNVLNLNKIGGISGVCTCIGSIFTIYRRTISLFSAPLIMPCDFVIGSAC